MVVMAAMAATQVGTVITTGQAPVAQAAAAAAVPEPASAHAAAMAALAVAVLQIRPLHGVRILAAVVLMAKPVQPPVPWADSVCPRPSAV